MSQRIAYCYPDIANKHNVHKQTIQSPPRTSPTPAASFVVRPDRVEYAAAGSSLVDGVVSTQSFGSVVSTHSQLAHDAVLYQPESVGLRLVRRRGGHPVASVVVVVVIVVHNSEQS